MNADVQLCVFVTFLISGICLKITKIIISFKVTYLVALNLLEGAVGFARRHVVRVAPAAAAAAGALPRPAGLRRRPVLRPTVH